MLARIRAATAPTGHPPARPVPRDYARTGTHAPGSAELLDLLRDRLVDYRATVVDCGRGRARGDRRGAGRDRRPRSSCPPGCPAGWAGPAASPTTGLSPAELDAVRRRGHRVRAAACAETGTIVARRAAPTRAGARSRWCPTVHVCVVRADQVVQTVPELLARLDPRRPLTFISGPSATSDIELDRVEGVHGPRTLVVVLDAP